MIHAWERENFEKGKKEKLGNVSKNVRRRNAGVTRVNARGFA